MKGKLSYLLSLSLLLSACSYDQVTEVCPEVRMEPVNVTFTLSLQDAARTKADDNKWDGNGYVQEAGTAFENRILKETVKVFAYNADGTYAGEVPLLQWTGTAANPVFHGYFNATTAGTYKFVVIANCTNESYSLAYDYGTNMPDLNNLLFKAPDLTDQTVIDNGAIPMWGIRNFTIGNDTESIDLESIWLLRSLAKVEVKLDASLTSQYALTDVTISNVSNTGFSLPKYDAWKALENTTILTHDNGFNAYMTAQTTNGVALAAETSGSSYYLYVPEYDNVSGTYAESYISLNVLEDGKVANTEPFKLYFRPYSAGVAGAEADRYNVVRNHIYRYTITKVNIGSDLSLICEVQPWTVNEESWNYTDQVSIDAGGELTWTDESIVSKPSGEVVTTGGTLTCSFKLATPTDATWQAEFIPVSGDRVAFKFVATDGSEVDTISGNVGEAATLTIKTAQTNITQNNIALLRITVHTKDGRTIVVKDLLPSGFDADEYTLIHSM